jgi:hypothetical protein
MAQNSELDDEFQALSSLDKSFSISIEQLPGNNINIHITIDKSKITQNYLELKENLKFLLYVKKKPSHSSSKFILSLKLLLS